MITEYNCKSCTVYVLICNKVVIIQSVYSAYSVTFYLWTTLRWPIPIQTQKISEKELHYRAPIIRHALENLNKTVLSRHQHKHPEENTPIIKK